MESKSVSLPHLSLITAEGLETTVEEDQVLGDKVGVLYDTPVAHSHSLTPKYFVILEFQIALF